MSAGSPLAIAIFGVIYDFFHAVIFRLFNFQSFFPMCQACQASALFFSFSMGDSIRFVTTEFSFVAFFEVITDCPVLASISLPAFPAMLPPSLATAWFSVNPCGF